MTATDNRSLGLVFLGTPEYAAVSLRRLLASRHRVLAVVTRPDKPRGRGQEVEPCAVKRVAREAGIEVLDPASPRDPAFLERFRALGADLGVVVAYGRILPREALEAPRLGCINAHASVLPLLRGAAPIERAILAGLDETGVTIMQMNEGLDEGDILMVGRTPIPPAMTGEELREVLAVLSASLLAEAVDRMAGDDPPRPVPQDHAKATFAPPLKKEEAALRFEGAARDLALRVRAFAPRPGAFAFDDGTRIKVLEARAMDREHDAAPGSLLGETDAGLLVACGRGVLELRIVQPEGRRAMRAVDYERGRRCAGASRVLHGGA